MKPRKRKKGKPRAFGDEGGREGRHPALKVPKTRIKGYIAKPERDPRGRKIKPYVEGKPPSVAWRPYRRLPKGTFLYLRLTPEMAEEIFKFCNRHYIWRDGLMERLSLEVCAWMKGNVESLHFFGRYSNADPQTLREPVDGASAVGGHTAEIASGGEPQAAPEEPETVPVRAVDGPDVQPAAFGETIDD